MKWIRPAISLVGILGLTAGFFMGKIGAEAYVGIIGVVVTFWFKSRDAEKDKANRLEE